MRSYVRDERFWFAVAVLMGTMIGVGIYGIPFAFAKAGFWIGLAWLVLLAGVMALFYVLSAELILVTDGYHQLSGYVEYWLGSWGKRLLTLAMVLGIYGALLAYIIVVGEFLHTVLSQFFTINPQWYGVGFAVFWSFFWLIRIRTAAAVELALASLYVVTILLIAFFSAPHVQVENLTGFTPYFWFLPYGVVLFALSGLSALPIQRRLLRGREQFLKPAILWAVGGAAVLYALFAFVVVGVSGSTTSPEAITGLFGLLGQPIVVLASILGVFTISTSYLMLGTALFETFTIDYRVNRFASWMLTAIPPLFFFWSWLRNFIDVIALIGAVSVGVQAILFLGSYIRARTLRPDEAAWRLRVPMSVLWFLIFIFSMGVAYELIVR